MPHIPSVVLKCYVNRTPPAPGELLLGFKVPDVDQILERAVAHGGAVAKEAVDRPEYGVRVAFLTDVEGHMIEIVQPI
jgi:predicted enzyme related to lactoylglutathione lyase